MSDDLAILRADYEKAFGKKPFNGWSADDLKAKIGAGPAVTKPVPSQAKVDQIREDATAAEPAKKPKDNAETAADPYPTQADLDAMRAGTFKEYKTR